MNGIPVPGLITVFAGGRATFAVTVLGERGGAAEIGRDPSSSLFVNDPLVSRQHAQVACDGARWTIWDLNSRNGTTVDGAPLRGRTSGELPGQIRTGGAIFLPVPDVRKYLGASVATIDGVVRGPAAEHIMRKIRASGDALFIRGESGSGKELVARAFHAAGPSPRGPFVTVSCATLPETLAERLLFGAGPGAASLLQSAAGGTLYLDELGALSLGVQARILRILEAGEADVRICAATHEDIHADTTVGRFHPGLHERLAVTTVVVPPLRERREEIPALIAHGLRGAVPRVIGASLVESCLVRAWPGNVRELLCEVRAAAARAVFEGAGEIGAEHLSPIAGWRPNPAPAFVPARVLRRERLVDHAGW